MSNRMRTMIEKLKDKGKKSLCIWPLHTILGTPGHALDPTLMEVIYFHAAARGDQYDLTEKGMSQSAEQDASPVKVETAAQKRVRPLITLVGTAIPNRKSIVAPEIEGLVTHFPVIKGQKIKKGDL